MNSFFDRNCCVAIGSEGRKYKNQFKTAYFTGKMKINLLEL